MNPLFNMFGGGQQPQMFPFGMIQQFNQFRQAFQGDPRQQVQNLLNSYPSSPIYLWQSTRFVLYHMDILTHGTAC